MNSSEQSHQLKPALVVVPLGGCGEFGMNTTAFHFNNKLYLVDCGASFTDPHLLGTDITIPKLDDYFAEYGSPSAYFITHGHEDHIGALPHIASKWPAPIYATAWAGELIVSKFAKIGLKHPENLNIIEAGDKVAGEDFSAEFIGVSHSIPMACALMLKFGQYRVFHTGDFKVQSAGPLDTAVDESHLKRLGDQGVDLLLADSTNSHKAGFCPGEDSVISPLNQIIASAKGAVFFTTFASNFWRLNTVSELCAKHGRQLVPCGTGVENTLDIARKLNMFNPADKLIVDDVRAAKLPRKKLLYLVTGCQAEWRSVLSRIAQNEHKTVKVHREDSIIISARIIPGNERYVQRMVSKLVTTGAEIFTTQSNPSIHVSGHGFAGDLQHFIKLLRPRCYIPVHGTHTHLRHNALIADEVAPPLHCQPVVSGDIIEVKGETVEQLGQIDIDTEFIDGDANTIMSYQTLRQRLRIGESGLAVISGVYSQTRQGWDITPEITLSGLQLPGPSSQQEWETSLAKEVARSVTQQGRSGPLSQESLRETVRISLRRRLAEVLNKKPVVQSTVFLV